VSVCVCTYCSLLRHTYRTPAPHTNPLFYEATPQEAGAGERSSVPNAASARLRVSRDVGGRRGGERRGEESARSARKCGEARSYAVEVVESSDFDLEAGHERLEPEMGRRWPSVSRGAGGGGMR